MNNIFKYNDLYDCYHKLLTPKERLVFEAYYFENLSFQEIAINNGVSRSAVHKMLQVCRSKLDSYESILKLKQKNRILTSILTEPDLTKVRAKIRAIIKL